jgi:hypothetical protein
VSSGVERPMPCDNDEVYVWDDYPTTATCVLATDPRSP